MSKSRKLIWDPTDDSDVKRARKEFNQALREGLVAYKQVARVSKVRKEIRRFDPNLGEVLLVPQLVGG